jgi:hypothetical protein
MLFLIKSVTVHVASPQRRFPEVRRKLFQALGERTFNDQPEDMYLLLPASGPTTKYRRARATLLPAP